MLILALAIAFFFAMNIGASGVAATMGVSYGSGAIKKKWLALLLVAIAVFLGAVLGGGEVVKTIGEKVVPANVLTTNIVVVILFSATFTLFIANLMGIPLSTSEVTIGSIVGVGVALQALYVKSILVIVLFWFIVPLAAFVMAFLFGKGIRMLERRFPSLKDRGKWKKWLGLLVIMTGVLEAFAAGMNNVGNAVGPLVGAGLIPTRDGMLWGGFFVALGALVLGSKVLETNGKKITQLTLLQGSAISGTGGILVVIASLFGLPVPLTQVTTTAIMGIGTADHGMVMWKKNIVSQIIKVWLVSPVVSLVVSYTLMHTVLEPNPYALIAAASVFVSTIGVISLYRTVKKEKRILREEGEGI